MSDPVTNIEIEDVLSSIRRLVSDEARASERGEKELSFSSDTPPQAVELESENRVSSDVEPGIAPKMPPPALVLTPALRIEPEVVEADLTEQPEDASNVEHNTDDTPALILTQVVAAEENTENSSDSDDVEQDQSETAAQQDPEPEHEAPVVSEDYGEPDEPVSFEMDDAPQVEADFVDDISDAFEAHEEEQKLEAGQDDTGAADEDEPLTIEDKIAALEALISRSDSDFEPDGGEVGGNAGRPGRSLPWEDSKEPRVSLQSNALPDPQEASQAAIFSDGAAAFQRAHTEAVQSAQAEIEENATETLLGTDEISKVLDEEALRDMVAEIVRQELQGPLGERITRNVRKLVRREIYRAMAANELG